MVLSDRQLIAYAIATVLLFALLFVRAEVALNEALACEPSGQVGTLAEPCKE